MKKERQRKPNSSQSINSTLTKGRVSVVSILCPTVCAGEEWKLSRDYQNEIWHKYGKSHLKLSICCLCLKEWNRQEPWNDDEDVVVLLCFGRRLVLEQQRTRTAERKNGHSLSHFLSQSQGGLRVQRGPFERNTTNNKNNITVRTLCMWTFDQETLLMRNELGGRWIE